MNETQRWREQLGTILRDTKVKQKVANELGINILTLTRWIKGEATPRPQNLRLLLNALPEHRSSLLESMPQGWKNAIDASSGTGELVEEIPSTFFVRVLDAYSRLPEVIRFDALCDMVMERMLKQLDPHRVGMEITLARCSPLSHEGKVRTLREILGRGTPPWKEDIAPRALLLGSEALAGYVARIGHPLAIQSREGDESYYPAHWTPWEKSAMACPLLRGGRVAGCLVISSTRPGHFLEARQTLIHQFTQLIALVFESDEFYDFDSIELYRMPSHDVQQAYYATFRQRVNELLREAQRQEQSLSLGQAEMQVWHLIEEELAQVLPRQVL